MSYTSITFICFLLVTGIAYFLVPRRVQWGVLLAASLGFYVLSCGARTLLLVVACGILYGTGLLIGRLADGFAARKKELAKEDRKALKKAVTQQKSSSCSARCSWCSSCSWEQNISISSVPSVMTSPPFSGWEHRSLC